MPQAERAAQAGAPDRGAGILVYSAETGSTAPHPRNRMQGCGLYLAGRLAFTVVASHLHRWPAHVLRSRSDHGWAQSESAFDLFVLALWIKPLAMTCCRPVRGVLRKVKPRLLSEPGFWIKPLAMTYSCMDQCHTTIGV